MPRIALAGFSHETNTFSPIPTPYEIFTNRVADQRGILEAEDIARLRGQRLNNGFCGFYDTVEQLGYECVPLLFASATPSAQVTKDAFDRILGRICSLLKEKSPFDGVYLSLHGAMVYEEYNDGETEILRQVRSVVGSVPIVASLDLHGNITQESVDLASVLVGFRTYPHVDIFETGQRCARAMHDLLQGKALFKAYRMLPFIMPVSSMSTNTEPARTLYKRLDELEAKPGMISLSLMEGFPPADVAHAGPSIFSYADSKQAAEEAADQLNAAVLSHESEFVSHLLSIDDAVQKAILLSSSASKPVILADVQDNAGAGSTSDTPWLLEALVRHGAKGVALGVMFDPEAATAAHTAGVGSQVTLGLGGKLTPGQLPYHATFKVEKLFEGEFTATGPMGRGRKVNLGKMAQLRVAGVGISVSSVRTQALDQSYFRQVGIEPAEMKILVLKSSNHYRADFEPISSAILQVAAPAAMINDPAHIPYRNLRQGVRLGGNGPEYHG